MILMMTKYGDHGYQQRFDCDADVKRFFAAQGFDWSELVQTCRSNRQFIPLIENLIGSTFRVSGSMKAAVVTDAATDKEKEIDSVKGPGTLTICTYLQLFENAATNLERCVENGLIGDLQSCVSSGIASIDAYITYRVCIYNANEPSEPLIDNRNRKVSQDTKIDEWIPKMSGGKKLDKSRLNWNHFKRLRAVRDDLAIHVKKIAFGINDKELCELLNMFRSGIAGLLADLHCIFSERMPCGIIRNTYLPDIRQRD